MTGEQFNALIAYIDAALDADELKRGISCEEIVTLHETKVSARVKLKKLLVEE